MADSTPPDEFKTRLFEVKGFREIQEEFLRCSGEVEEGAMCVHCKCIPREIYRLLCPKHGLCIDCKNFCEGYYCPECRVNTKAEQLKDVRPDTNYKALYLWVLCQGCDKEMMLGELEKHLIHCRKCNMKCPDCGLVVLIKELDSHQLTQCPNYFGRCDGCSRQMPMKRLNEHRYVCPKIIKTCPKCNANVTNEDWTNHVQKECQKRVIHCGACSNAIPFDEQEEHEKGCPRCQVTCVDCDVQVLRMDYNRHREWYPERLTHCELCNNWCRYSQKEAHRKECSEAVKRSAVCEDVFNEDIQYNQCSEPKVQRVFGNACSTQEHGPTCLEVRVECSKCGDSILEKDCTAHMSTVCKKRLVDCEACHRRMPCDEIGKHAMECEENRDKCPDCDLLVFRKDMCKHLSEDCSLRQVHCELCAIVHLYSQKEKHLLTECPKVAKECPDCAVPVFNEDLHKHLSEECQKRVKLCQACCSPMAFDELNEHDKVCKDKPVSCEKCHCTVVRNEITKHLQEACSERVICCEACKQDYIYSKEMEHLRECGEWLITCYQCECSIQRKDMPNHVSKSCPKRIFCCEQCSEPYPFSQQQDHRQNCVMRIIPCEHCKAELRASDDRNEHFLNCEKILVECSFKEYGCVEKGPRREMQSHEKTDAHNGVLLEVINKMQKENTELVKRIENMENRQRELDQYLVNIEDGISVRSTELQNLNRLERICQGPFEELIKALRDVDKA